MYSCDNKTEFSASLLQSFVILEKSFYADLVLNC